MRACQATTQKIHRASRSNAHGRLAVPERPARPDFAANEGRRQFAIASDPVRGCNRATRPPCLGHVRPKSSPDPAHHMTRPRRREVKVVGQAVALTAKLFATHSSGSKKIVVGKGLRSCGVKGFRPVQCAVQCGRSHGANQPRCRSLHGLRPPTEAHFHWFWRGPDLVRWLAAKFLVSSPGRYH